MAAEKLAELFVELQARGLDALFDDLEQLKKKLAAADKAAKEAGDGIKDAFKDGGDEIAKTGAASKGILAAAHASALWGKEVGDLTARMGMLRVKIAATKDAAEKIELEKQLKAIEKAIPVAKFQALTQGVQIFASAATKAFAIVTGGILGFVAAGLRGTLEGEALALRFQLLAREIANLFIPAITKAIDVLTDILNVFKSLSGSQQKAIGFFALGAVLVLGFAAAAAVAVVVVLKLVAAMIALNATVGFIPIIVGAVVVAIGAVVGAFFALMMQSEKGRATLKKMFDAAKAGFQLVASIVVTTFNAIMGVVGPFVDIFAKVWGRIADAATIVFTKLREGFEKVVVKLGPFLDILEGVVGFLAEMAEAFAMFALDTLIAAIDAAVAGFEMMIDVISKLIDSTRAGLNTMITMLNAAMAAIASGIEGAINAAIGALNALVEKLPKKIRSKLGIEAIEEVSVTAPKMGLIPEFGRDRTKVPKGKEGRQTLTPSTAAFEGIADTFNRLQLASLKTPEKTVEEKQLEAQEQGNSLLNIIAGGVGNLKPAFSK